ncbi:ATPase [Tothia fuscella]|uniref:ATPase n=1 Tax=Tothia fuscella TaxID=1048955 RepID=A0A9P4NG33_9PEZI|nr:ATPase [Tothia fuscella]
MEKPVVGGSFALKFHMLEIQSPVLVSALKDIVKKEDVHLEATETATFKHPFRPLWFCTEQILALQKTTAEGTTLRIHLNLLVQLLGQIFGGMRQHLKHLQTSGLASFKLLWTYYPKDSIIYSPDKDCERLYKVVDTEIKVCKGNPVLFINVKEISFDGDSFIWKQDVLAIPSFEGNRPITELEHYPLSLHPDPEDVKTRLIARGKKVLDYQGLTYCGYSGLGIFNDDTLDIHDEKHNVSGRILIDTYGYQKHHLALKRRDGKDQESKNAKLLKETIAAENANAILMGLMPPPPPPMPGVNISSTGNTSAAKEKPDDMYIKRLSDEDMKKNKDEMLARKDDLIYLSPMLVGYALKNKLWLSFYVDDIEPMQWNDEAYDHLVYPEEQKDLVLSFVENHKRTRTVTDDVIMGKGQGLILLLSGPPGTGKTLTAEAVADKTRRPLYYLQAEDLGINAAVLGSKIKKVFEMATEWDAVILLDEADVFMAERNPNDIARNELVSIFLREIEYFRGIIFLTTNLYDTIDTAFRSRVNIHLLFNPLPPASRLVLWKKFLDRIPQKQGQTRDLVDEDFEELSKWDLNGREIKNAIKTVKSWCDCKGYDLNLLRLESGIKVTAPQAKKRESGNSSLYD